jgi:hypothetical protein
MCSRCYVRNSTLKLECVHSTFASPSVGLLVGTNVTFCICDCMRKYLRVFWLRQVNRVSSQALRGVTRIVVFAKENVDGIIAMKILRCTNQLRSSIDN